MGEVPVGCVIVKNGVIIGRGHNLTNKTGNVSQIVSVPDHFDNK